MCSEKIVCHLCAALLSTLMISACAPAYHEADFVNTAPASGSVSYNPDAENSYRLYEGVMQY